MNGGNIGGFYCTGSLGAGAGICGKPNSEIIMNGGNIFGNVTGNDGGGVFTNGKMTFTGGTISFNSGKHGGGINRNHELAADSNGGFIMTGGKVYGNKATDAAAVGGGIYLGTKYESTITGGEIKNNISVNGGGIGANRDGAAVIIGGDVVISGNKATTGGGVYYAEGNLTIGGTANISGNTANGVANNLYLPTGKTVAISGTTPLATGANIGVSTAAIPAVNSPVNISSNGAATDAQYFHSDNPADSINFEKNNATPAVPVLKLAIPVAKIGYTKYFSLKDAVEAVKAANTTIDLLQAGISDTVAIVTPAFAITIELNGFAYTNSKAFTASKNLKVSDSKVGSIAKFTVDSLIVADGSNVSGPVVAKYGDIVGTASLTGKSGTEKLSISHNNDDVLYLAKNNKKVNTDGASINAKKAIVNQGTLNVQYSDLMSDTIINDNSFMLLGKNTFSSSAANALFENRGLNNPKASMAMYGGTTTITNMEFYNRRYLEINPNTTLSSNKKITNCETGTMAIVGTLKTTSGFENNNLVSLFSGATLEATNGITNNDTLNLKGATLKCDNSLFYMINYYNATINVLEGNSTINFTSLISLSNLGVLNLEKGAVLSAPKPISNGGTINLRDGEFAPTVNILNSGKINWDITDSIASVLYFNNLTNSGELDITTKKNLSNDTTFLIGLNTGSMDGKQFILCGDGEKKVALTINDDHSRVVVYAGRAYQLINKRAPRAKAEVGQKTVALPVDSLFLKVGYLPRIVVETDSTKDLDMEEGEYLAEPYKYHGGAVYVYDRGTFNAKQTIFNGNEAKLGAAIYNTGTTNLYDVVFMGNKAKMGGAIYNFDGTININGPIALVNDSDTWVNEGYKTGAEPQYAVTNWNLGKTPNDDNKAILVGYENFANYGHYAKQTITVAKNQAEGTYPIATGDFSNVENKDKFYITGVEGQEDIAVFITGGATKNYNGQGYTLKVNGHVLYLTIGEPLAKIDVAVSSMNKATIYSDKNLVVPAGVRVFGMKWDDSKNMLVCTNSRAYTDGDILPAEMGYVIEAPAATYSFLETEQDASVVSLSELSGVVVETPTDEVEGTVFTLANGYNGVGFYTFIGETLKANKAFYNSTNPNLKGYLGCEDTTGIETSLTPTLSSREGVYNLQGQQVNKNYRGVVIKNGKKVIMK